MHSGARQLLIVLLCCLLPVQGTLAFAQSVGKVSHHARALQAAALARATHKAPLAHHLHHHGHPQAHHAGLWSVDKSVKVSTKSIPHSQASCTDCAKCCLTGATAPPPAIVQPSAVSFVLSVFQRVSTDLAAHLPEKPERPPRAFPRALS